MGKARFWIGMAWGLAASTSWAQTPLNYNALGTDIDARTLITRWAQREDHPVVWRLASPLPLNPGDVNERVHLDRATSLADAMQRLQVYLCRDVPEPTHVVAALFPKGPMLVEIVGQCPPMAASQEK